MAKSKKRKIQQQSKPAHRHHDNPLRAKSSQTRKPTTTSKPAQSKPTSTSTSTAQKQKPREPTIPFDPNDRILLVGEGDLSFARSLLDHHGCADLTCTVYDSHEELLSKYPQAATHIEALEAEGQTVLYCVDATKLGQTGHGQGLDAQGERANVRVLRGLRDGGKGWERILFNFPHVGGKSTDVNRQVRYNQEMLVSFFTASEPLLAPSGTIIVTLFEGEPYTLWNVKDLARHAGLTVQRSFAFRADAYPGYSHARTLGNIAGGGGWKGEDRAARSYIFEKKAAVSGSGHAQRGSAKKRKRSGGDDSGDSDG